MPVTRILIGGDIPQDLIGEMSKIALTAGFRQKEDGVPVWHAFQDYVQQCADSGKPIALYSSDPVFIGNKPPRENPLVCFLGEHGIHCHSFRGPSEGVDGEIEVFSPATGYARCPATALGEPLLTAGEIEHQKKSLGTEESPANADDVLYYLSGFLQSLKEHPPAAVITAPSPGLR
jgi:hypothetical protein